MQCLGSFKFWFRSGSALEKNGSGSRSWTFIQDLMIFLTEEEFELFFFFFHFFLRIRILQSKILQIQRILISILKKKQFVLTKGTQLQSWCCKFFQDLSFWLCFDYSRILFTPEEMKEFQFHAHKVPGAR